MSIMSGALPSSGHDGLREMEVEIERDGSRVGAIQLRLLVMESTIADLAATIRGMDDASKMRCMLGRDNEEPREVMEEEWPRFRISRIPTRHTRITLKLITDSTLH